uniref:SWIM-type domain-containing protein n=1 Tax=Yoonia rhodophyticola TaxID=3137370 RepID=A0AAN0NJQ6_9RHOB
MTLSAMIAVHDETALAALASVGVVRRAKRDFEAGKAVVESRDEAAATVTADGKAVMIPAAGLPAATCDCPATGICRHILLAVFALREDPSAEMAPVTSATDELHALDEAGLRKFAGADWDKAINLARISGRATLTEDGANLSVQLPDVAFPVVFLAGQGLAGAVFKGAKSAKRRMTAAAALVARQRSGAQTLDQITQDEDQIAQMSPAFLGRVQAAITALVAGVFGGGSVVAEDLVFDLSISARAQAAPRLTALLRGLVQQSRKQRAHHIAFREDRFLADAARAYALAKALAQHPEDTQLTGTLRRNYRDHDDIDLIMLGAVQWTAASGARGLRLYGYAPATGAWYTTGQARGPEWTPGFRPAMRMTRRFGPVVSRAN